jgi:glyoxylase-like metal-dependent hydrolase (beta-lactamase superfamily II)
MRVHHLNCGTCCPTGGRLFDGTTDGPSARLVCHCWLLETDAGLVLVDTGYGLRDRARRTRISAVFRALNRPQFRAEETAAARVKALGFRTEDVRHIVVTHLDFDHAGGLEDFPHAAVHVTAREREAADDKRGGAMGAKRYRPAQWDEVTDWRLYPFGGGEAWHGFDCVRDLEGLPPEILLVPLAGHTWGHAGVAVDTGNGWLLHAGDAYFFRGEMGETYRCPPGLAGYQRLMEVDRAARLANQARLRALARGGDVRIVSAHDPVELELCGEAR